ncbi:MAG: DNA-3-methyladenine glycosylase [Candidatus Acidiferrales bacterium]
MPLESSAAEAPTDRVAHRIRLLRRTELPSDAVELARYLIGKSVVRELSRGAAPRRIAGRVVETEAYVPGDAAAHAFIGPTPRNRSLFLERGHAYVYFCYGMHYMLNMSAESAGIGAGVLIRALEPIEGVDLIERHRGTKRLIDLARGPGRVAEALRIGPRLDGIDLCAQGPLWLGTSVRDADAIGTSVRIGITKEAHRLLRFYERGSPFVSGPKRLCA